jgi:serine protease Do
MNEETTNRIRLAQVVILSSCVTLLIVAGIGYVVRDRIVAYVASEAVGLQREIPPPPPETTKEPLVEMVEKANPAVVSVVVTKNVPVYERYLETIDPWGVFRVPRLRENGTRVEEVGGGSGFIVSPDGMIVTNNHVVADESALYSILLNTGATYTVDVLARDAELDIAILKINQPFEEKLTYLEFGDSNTLKLGQTVVAIGNALAEFQNSVSVGVVSGLSRSIVASDQWGKSEALEEVIQTDAAINPGNSGGPLLALDGTVVGVNVATSRGADNIGFALPAKVVKQAVDSVREYGEIVRPFIGVRYAIITPRLKEANKLTVDYGVLVTRGQTDEELAVMPGSPADKAGIVENDIILSIDGEELRDKDLATLLRSKAVNQEIALKVLHKGEEKQVSLVLGKAE